MILLMHYDEGVDSSAESSRNQHSREAGIRSDAGFSLVRRLEFDGDDHECHEGDEQDK